MGTARFRIVGWLTGILFVTFLAGCPSDLSVPDKAHLICTEDVPGACPENYTCVVALERCIKRGADAVSPNLSGAMTVTPAIANAEATVTIVFTADEPLGTDPTVTLLGPGGEVGRATLESSAENTWTFVYPPTGDEPEGEDLDVAVELTDEAGNVGRAVSTGALRFDFTAPDIVSGSVEVSLSPGADNPLQTVTVWGPGTTGRALFTVTEALVAEPTVEAGAGRTMAAELVAPPTFRFSLTWDGSGAEGATVVQVHLEDLAGNTRTVDLGTTELDATPPSPPPAGDMVHVRAPWGQAAVNALDVSAATLEPSLLLLVHNDAAGTVELGRGQADSAGALGTIVLINLDTGAPWVSAVDPAGNVSEAVQVPAGRLTVPVAKAAPVEGFRTASARPTPLPPEAQTLLALDDGAEVDANVLRAFSAGRWRARRDMGVEHLRTGAVIGTDPLTGEVWQFGGLNAFFNPEQTTWSWDNGWREETLAGAVPPARVMGAAAYHEGMRRWVVVSGAGDLSAGTPLDDTWLWDGETWAPWEGAGPPPRLVGAMAYDRRRGVIVYTGGGDLNSGGLLTDTWEFGPEGWTERLDLAGAPTPSVGAVSTYDPASGQVLVTGGCADFNCDAYVTETWGFDGVAWTRVSNTAPNRFGGTFVWDSVRDEGIIFGDGRIGAGSTGDTAVFSNQAWSLPTLTNPPPVRSGVAGFWFPETGSVAFWGGFNGSGDLWYADLRTWDGTAWTRHHGLGESAPRRLDADLVWDAARKQAVHFGGTAADCGNPIGSRCGETWLWEDGFWQLATTTMAPEARSNYGMTWDAAREVVVLVGGGGGDSDCDGSGVPLCRDTWQFDGTDWRPLCGPAHTAWVTANSLTETCPVQPDSARRDAVTFDVARGRVMLLSVTGCATDACGLWEGQWTTGGYRWTQVCGGTTGCTLPAEASSSSTLVYHEALGETFLIGDDGTDTHVFVWDGTAFVSRCDPTSGCASPGRVREGAVSYDPRRARIVLQGGSTGTDNSVADLWTFDGERWALREVAGAISPSRERHGLAFDPIRKTFLVSVGASTDSRVWTWQDDPDTTPALVLAFDATATGQAPDTLQAIELTATAGGTGYTTDTESSTTEDLDLLGAPVHGVVVEAWDALTLQWREVTTADHPAQTPGSLVASLDTDPRWFVAPGTDAIYLRVRTAQGQGNGPAPAEVSVDAFAVTLVYGP